MHRLRALTHQLLLNLSQISDLLEPFAAFKAYHRRGVEASISCSRAAELPAGVADWAFRLCKANMQVLLGLKCCW